MARKRDPRRDKAKRIWLESNGEKQLKDIASELNVSDSQIRKWKSIDKWSAELKGNVTNAKGNVTNQGGAPFGNQNAKGNKGNSRASPPVGNKNALKTGEYETIFYETLSDEEKDIYSSLNDDPSFVLSEEIRLLKIRQFRMMKRIQQAEAGLNDEEIERLQQLRKIKTPIEKDGKKLEIKREAMQDVQVSRKTYRKIDDILSIEDALTRISNQLTKAIKQLNVLAKEESRNKVYNNQANKLKVEIDMLKLKADLLRSDSEKSTEEKLYNLTMRVNRLELLKANIGLELISLFDELDKYFSNELTKAGLEELKRQAGILEMTIPSNRYAKFIEQIIRSSFLSDDVTFSDRLWMYQSELKSELDRLLVRSITMGKNPKQLASKLAEYLTTEGRENTKFNTQRLMVTETTRNSK